MVGPSQILLLGTQSQTTGVVSGVTAGTSVAIVRSGFGLETVYFRSLGTTSGGTLLIEEADWMKNEVQYAGTWSVIATVQASSFTGTAQIAYHVANTALGYLRVRISSAITGGGSVVVILRSQSNL